MIDRPFGPPVLIWTVHGDGTVTSVNASDASLPLLDRHVSGPETVTINGVNVHYSMWNVGARIYPFGDVLFVGAVYGHYGVDATATIAQGTGSVRASSDFLGPQIGARWIQPSGFFFGIDVAWAFPLGYTSEASNDPSGTTTSVKETADRYLRNGIPLVGLVSVGWMF